MKTNKKTRDALLMMLTLANTEMMKPIVLKYVSPELLRYWTVRIGEIVEDLEVLEQLEVLERSGFRASMPGHCTSGQGG